MSRNVPLLTLAAALSMSSSVVVVLLGGIVGSRLAPTALLATLPVSLMIVGTALTAVPAALLMQRLGRRAGFSLAAAVGAAGALLAAWSVDRSSFAGLCVATAAIGANLAFAQQYRFAAAESVPLARVSHAVSAVLLGPIAAAWLGPAVATRLRHGFGLVEHGGAFVGVSFLLAVAALVVLGLRPSELPAADPTVVRPALGALLVRPRVRVAILAGVVGYGVMSFVMTATPVSMHVLNSFSMADTTLVIRSHVLGMYVPSLVSGALIARWGTVRGMAAGVAALAGSAAFTLVGHGLHHYWIGLVLLGIGWNLSFVSGTTLLAQASRPGEQFRLQAANEFAIFSMTAAASLLSGPILHHLGWSQLIVLTLPALALLGAAAAWLGRREKREIATDFS